MSSHIDKKHTMTFRIITIFALVNAAFAAQPMKVLIATGWGTEVGNGITDTEIIDLFDQANVCDTHDYPLPVQGAVGDLVGDTPMICGGLWYDENGQPIQYKECHKLTAHGFELVSTTSIGMSGQTGIAIDDKLWITGYGYGNEDYTEFVSLSGEVTPGPLLPENLIGHCLVKTGEESKVMMIGGQQHPDNIGRTYLLDVLTGAWTEGPELEFARAFHSCGLFELGGKKYVLVIGGEGQDTSYLTSVEILDVDAIEDGWKQIAPLPLALFDPVAVSFGNRLVVVGGTKEGYEESLDIYEFVCPNIEVCEWVALKKKLTEHRMNFVAMPIPDELVTCE